MKKYFALSLLFFVPLANALVPADANYNGNCAYTLATTGSAVPTDCSVNWKDPVSNTTYCFGSEEARTKWAMDTKENLSKSNAAFAKLKTESALSHAGSTLEGAKDATKDALKGTGEAVGKAASKTAEVVKDTAKKAYDATKDAVNNTAEKTE